MKKTYFLEFLKLFKQKDLPLASVSCEKKSKLKSPIKDTEPKSAK